MKVHEERFEEESVNLELIFNNSRFSRTTIRNKVWQMFLTDSGKLTFITILARNKQRTIDCCCCDIHYLGSIRYFGNEEWQNSHYFIPKFPQEVPSDIALSEDDYKLAMVFFANHKITHKDGSTIVKINF